MNSSLLVLLPSATTVMPGQATAPRHELVHCAQQTANAIPNDCLKMGIICYQTLADQQATGTPCGHTDIFCSGEINHTGDTSSYYPTYNSACICP
jgi:hypothetical protein